MRAFLCLILLALPGVTLAQVKSEPIKPAEPKKADEGSAAKQRELGLRLEAFRALEQVQGEAVKRAEAKKADDASAKLAELEARLEAMLKDIQALRGAKKMDTVRREDKATVRQLEAARIAVPAGQPSGEYRVLIGEPAGAGKSAVEWKVLPQGQQAVAGARIALPAASLPGAANQARVLVADGDNHLLELVQDQIQGYYPQAQALRIATVEDPNTVHLTRVTYALGAAKAKALETFLKEQAKAKVLETKLDGDKLIVTTTPDVQTTIGQVVRLMSDKPASSYMPLQLRLSDLELKQPAATLKLDAKPGKKPDATKPATPKPDAKPEKKPESK